MSTHTPRVVVVGAGFAGLRVARGLAHSPVDITLKVPRAFHYNDLGALATIGRNSAVANVKGIKLSGFPAWFVWLSVHLIRLVGFRNRLVVLINWAWDYVFLERASRIILRYHQRTTHENSSSATT